jgi:hypothetical protein
MCGSRVPGSVTITIDPAASGSRAGAGADATDVAVGSNGKVSVRGRAAASAFTT